MTKANGYSVNYVTAFFGPKPYTFGDGMVALAEYAQQMGVDFFYETPGVQLSVGEDGGVCGVIGKGKDGYVLFNAAKGVVLACGDFQNDEAMSNYFMPECRNIDRKCVNRTGDGHKMGYWAGAALSGTYSKMVHDMDAGPVAMMDQPFFLNVNQKGERFAPESIGMYVTNNYVNDEDNAGWYAPRPCLAGGAAPLYARGGCGANRRLRELHRNLQGRHHRGTGSQAGHGPGDAFRLGKPVQRAVL